MKKKPVWIRISLIAISIIFFIILAIPNAKASENIAMVSMFEPDEGIMIPVIKSMTALKNQSKIFSIISFCMDTISTVFHFLPHPLW